MKKAAALLLAPLLLTLTAGAQLSGNTGNGKEKTKIKTKVGDTKAWAVKWNPESLAFGKIGLSGEYNLKRKKSITFGVGIPIERNWSRNTTDEKIDLNTKTSSVMGGYRMYLGKKSMSGFYFEPYLKYVNMKATGLYDNKNSSDPKLYQSDIKYSGVGLGAQLGVQFSIAKVVVIDLFILGPEANTSKFDASFRDISPYGLLNPWDFADEQEARNDVQDAVKDIPIVGDKLAENTTVDRNSRTVKTNYDGFLPGLRFGLSVGVRF